MPQVVGRPVDDEHADVRARPRVRRVERCVGRPSGRYRGALWAITAAGKKLRMNAATICRRGTMHLRGLRFVRNFQFSTHGRKTVLSRQFTSERMIDLQPAKRAISECDFSYRAFREEDFSQLTPEPLVGS